MCSRTIPSIDPTACDTVANAYSVTLRIASAVAATRPTSDAVVDAICVANCACLCAIINPMGEIEFEQREPALDLDSERVRRLSNVVFGANVCVVVPS